MMITTNDNNTYDFVIDNYNNHIEHDDTVGAGLPPVCTPTSRQFNFWYCLKGV